MATRVNGAGADWAEARRRTPAADACIHLNHASTSLPDETVFRAQQAFLDLEAQLGTHRAAERMEPALMAVPAAVAELVSARAHQVALLDSASAGFASALSAVAPEKALEVFATRHEWASNLMCISVMRRATLRVVERSPDEAWHAAFSRALRDRDRCCVPVVSMPMLPSHCGIRNDFEGLARVVSDAHGWLFADASQTVGQFVVNFELGQFDVMVFPARKWLRGPRGVAALVLSDRALDAFGAPAAPDIHGTQFSAPAGMAARLVHREGAARFQPYGHHPALRLGLAAAVTALTELGIATVEARVRDRATALRRRLAAIEELQMEEAGDSGLVCMRARSAHRQSHESIVQALWHRGINAATVGARYAPLLLAPQDSLIRLSPHAITTDDEIEVAALAMEETLRC